MDALLQFFAYEHFPPHLKAVSKPFGDIAQKVCAELPRIGEHHGMRKSLEAQGCAARAVLFKDSAANIDG
ncbi:hypothetical protein GGD63_007946 [Bradyrhizobium sp. cir1]|uniref:hypothetical protein n=1 Tax=Bradyrhizobium sp. cir1 TaxID=1445730 RepID=UPI001606D1A2|nr:hypothetical protein [Bradyrhizobium sp. cir1]MBB4375102.1 hypothetical protein [Bradyrhizobium sp. cir1]